MPSKIIEVKKFKKLPNSLKLFVKFRKPLEFYKKKYLRKLWLFQTLCVGDLDPSFGRIKNYSKETIKNSHFKIIASKNFQKKGGG